MNSAFARQHRSGLLKAIEIVEPLVADRIILLQLLLLLKRLVFLRHPKSGLVGSLVELQNLGTQPTSFGQRGGDDKAGGAKFSSRWYIPLFAIVQQAKRQQECSMTPR
jgi:hypothetical protein